MITGASGFLGSYVTSAALKQGHQVKAIVRPHKTALSWLSHPDMELIALDLATGEGLVEALAQVDGVIHLAAAKTGDYSTQYSGTVQTTENLLTAMSQAMVNRLIAISSFSVYDYLNIPAGATVTEDSPLESKPQFRDIYAQTKLIQETKCREFAQKGGKVTIIRPGMIYGRDYLWNACLGSPISPNLWLRIGNEATIPLIYVENCAEAIVKAAQQTEAIAQTLNLVDDDLPQQKIYVQKLQEKISNNPSSILLPWSLVNSIAGISWSINQNLFQGKLKLPSTLIPPRLHARFKQLNYTNERAKGVLLWQPRYSLDTALERIGSNLDLLAVN
ncbi:nucleoside-diphosphate-sugar epimerase [Gloeocapsa sp. PCC 73106]|nr:nucleoside-diphosphate-sugar epimerase [Gloeocapsa sp. PCC 73106]